MAGLPEVLGLPGLPEVPWRRPRSGGPRPRALPRTLRAERGTGSAVAERRRGGGRSGDCGRVVQSARHGACAWRAGGRESRRREEAAGAWGRGVEVGCLAEGLVQHAVRRIERTGAKRM
jgi:hypothetical protein